jgi:hypothetical protein
MDYLKSNRTLPAAPAESVSTRSYFSIGAEFSQAQALGEFADCLISSDPVKADALLRTSWGDAEERTSARALAPLLSQCLPQGMEIALRVESIRSYVASGLWQRFEAGKQLNYEGRP